MLRRLLLTAVLMLLFATGLQAQYVKVLGVAERSGVAITSGINSTNKPSITYPGATITIYSPSGSGTVATLYSNSTGTPKANPYTASLTDATYDFFISPGASYDVTVSGTSGGVAITPFTRSGYIASDLAVSSDNVFNVRAYGAACDGVTDDTTEVIAAKDAAEATGNGAVLFFPGPCLMRKLTAGGELLLIRKALVLQGVNKNQSGIFASTDTPNTVDIIRYNPLGWPDTRGFTIRNMAITSAGRCEGNPLFGGCLSPGGGEWYQGPSISADAAIVFDTIGNANTYSIQGVLVENCSIGPTATAVAIYGTASSSNGTPAASAFNSNDIFGTVKWEDAGDSITFTGGRQIGPGYAHDVTMTASATKYSIIDPNITNDGGLIFHNGASPQIIGGIIEIYKSWRSPAAYGGANGAIIDFAGDLPGATVYQPMVFGTVVNSLSAASVDGVRMGTTQFGVVRNVHFDVPVGKFGLVNSSTAASTRWEHNQQFGNGDRWSDPANRLQLAVAAFATDPGVAQDLLGNLGLIGNARFSAPSTSAPARLQLNFTDTSQIGQVQFLINGGNAASIQMGGSTSTRPSSLDFIVTATGPQTWWTNNVRRLTLGSDGHWEPFANNSYDWGATAKRWRTGYFGTSVIAPTVNATTELQINGSPLNFSNLAGTVTPAQEAAFSGTTSYLMLPSEFTAGTPSSTPVGANNQVRAQRIYIDRRITFANLYFEVMTASAGGNCAVAVYNAAGTTKLIDSGAISTTATGMKTTAVSITLDKGYYWFAWTADNTTAAFRGLPQSVNWTPIQNEGTVHAGTAANASVAGAMPATLGVISAVSGMNVPIVKLQG